MPWSERQLQMLQEIGVRLWVPTESARQDGPAATGETAVVSAPPAAPLEQVSMPSASATTSAVAARQIAQPAAELTAQLTTQPAAAMAWPELRAAVSGCTACKLCEGRTQTVFGVGHERAHWMIVGEAPGEQEDRQGQPFVGKSGQLLDNMLRAIGLGRAQAAPETQVYIANTVKCRPPGNRNPEPDELAQCEPFLIRQVQLVQPRIILAMGRFAVQSLLRSTEPIGRLRGRVHRYQGVPLIVSYHPAYLLRNPEDKAKAWDDLCLALEALRAAGGA